MEPADFTILSRWSSLAVMVSVCNNKYYQVGVGLEQCVVVWSNVYLYRRALCFLPCIARHKSKLRRNWWWWCQAPIVLLSHTAELFLSDIKLKSEYNNDRTERPETSGTGALGRPLWVGVSAPLVTLLVGGSHHTCYYYPPEQGLKISQSWLI